ncbi:hypothetical protein [Sulfitobacter sp. SBS6]|uniref:hypothetical protein n=1 Tax=Sulfitobacter sp. SBS6 TaxID=3401755 RepID=UPI003AB0EECD
MWWTLAAALVAAGTALLIAFVAYPYQKKKDRKLKEHSEKLAAYQRFVFAVTSHHSLLASSLYEEEDRGIIAAYPNVVAASYEVIFYGPPGVISACQKYLETLLEYQNYVLGALGSEKHARASKEHPKGREAFIPSQRARRLAILAIRKDITDETEEAAQVAINAFFTMTPVEEETA